MNVQQTPSSGAAGDTMPEDAVIEALRADLVASGAELPPDFSADTEFNTIGIDSLLLAEFVARVEQRYRRPVPDAEWRGLRSLALVADWLARQPAR